MPDDVRPDGHPDSDHLARLALGAGLADAEVVAHLEDCEACRTEVDDLRELADLARSVRTERLEPPPPHVWQSVVDELGLGPRRRPRPAPWTWAVAAAVAGLVAGSLVTWAVVDDDAPTVAGPEVVRTTELERLEGTGGGGTHACSRTPTAARRSPWTPPTWGRPAATSRSG